MRFNPFYSQIRCTPIQNQESKKTMSNQTPEQLAEKEVNRFFGNRLTTEEYTLAVQIAKEIYHETKFNALAWAEWRERVSQFEQDLHTRLSQAEPPQRAALRFASLFLQQVACEAAKNIFSNPQESLIYLERGIEHAENFLTQNVIGGWIRGLNELRNRNMGNVARDLEKVMESEPVQILADTLSEWAAELEQLTVIFPAPLGQLPGKAYHN